jgi:hypothetical protein
MNTNPLRILALAAVVAWPSANQCRAQQLPQPAAGQGQAVRGLEQFQAVPALRQAMTVGYREPVETMPEPPQQGYVQGGYQGYAPQGGVQYDGVVYGGEQGQYMGYEGGYDGAYEGEPMGDYVWNSIYPAGQCYAYTRGEVLALTHNIQNDQPFTSLAPGGPIVLSANDLDLEYQAGIRVTGGIPLTHCTMIEASYMGLHEFSTSAAAVDPADFLFSVYSGFGLQGPPVVPIGVAPFIDASRSQTIAWESELHSAEANLLYRIPCRSCKQELWLLTGLRYVKVEEQLTYLTQSGLNAQVQQIAGSRTDVETDNDLIGVQLGYIFHHNVTKKIRLSFDGKSGVAANFNQQRTNVILNLTTTDVLLGREEFDDDALALTVDGGAALTLDVNCWFSITGGYRVLYLDGMALALENFNPVLPGTGLREGRLDHNGSVLYHGAHLGAEVRW